MSYQQIEVNVDETTGVSNNRLGKAVVGLLAVAATTAVVATRGSSAPLAQVRKTTLFVRGPPVPHSPAHAQWTL